MPDATSSTSRSDVAIVGAGTVGRVLALRLVDSPHPVAAVISRRRAPAVALAGAINAPIASDDLADLPRKVRAVFLCVPDDALASVARALAALPREWGGTVVAHLSGALTAEVLAPLADAGAATLSFHPMQTFTTTSEASLFDGIYIGLEGMPEAVAFGVQVATDLGGCPITVPTAAKTRYHLAGVLASNGLVALMGLVREVLESTGIDPDEAARLVGPLVRRTWTNLEATSPEAALTGPVVRGDTGTVAAHLEALATYLPHLSPVYAALANEMERLAVQSGRLDPEAAERLHALLAPSLHGADDAAVWAFQGAVSNSQSDNN